MNKKQFSEVPQNIANREWWGFNWLEHVTAVPAPLVLVTGYKENGMANGTMQSWFCFSNEGDFYCIFGSVNKNTHMYEIAKKTGQLAVNFPSKDAYERCMLTIQNNYYDKDELAISGLHYSNGTKVVAPIVDECFLNLECEVVWEKELFVGSDHVVLCVKIVNIWFDEEHFDTDQLGRYGERGFLYNIHSPLNPETGKEESTKVGVLTILQEGV